MYPPEYFYFKRFQPIGATFLLLEQGRQLHPVVKGGLCTAMIYLDAFEPYWVQVDCNNSSFTNFYICKAHRNTTFIDSDIEKDDQIQVFCDKDFVYISNTCWIIMEESVQADEGNICNANNTQVSCENMPMYVFEILVHYGIHQIKVISESPICLKASPGDKLCTPNKWNIEREENCTNTTEYIMCGKEPRILKGCL